MLKRVVSPIQQFEEVHHGRSSVGGMAGSFVDWSSDSHSCWSPWMPWAWVSAASRLIYIISGGKACPSSWIESSEEFEDPEYSLQHLSSFSLWHECLGQSRGVWTEHLHAARDRNHENETQVSVLDWMSEIALQPSHGHSGLNVVGLRIPEDPIHVVGR